MSEPAATIERARSRTEILLSYLLFLTVAAVLVASFALPSFRVSRITVVGATGARDEIETATGLVGANIFTIRTAPTLEEARRVPDILVCGVTESIPNTISICARKRVPVLGWKTKLDLYMVDIYGRLISVVSSTTLPVVRDTTPYARSPGEYVDPWIVTAARWALRELPNARLAGFTLGARHGLTIRSAQGWRAVIGRPDTPVTVARRVATLKALLAHAVKNRRRLIYADLTGANILVRLRPAAPVIGGSG